MPVLWPALPTQFFTGSADQHGHHPNQGHHPDQHGHGAQQHKPLTDWAVVAYDRDAKAYSTHLAAKGLRGHRLLIAIGCRSAQDRVEALRSGAHVALGPDATDEELELVLLALTNLRRDAFMQATEVASEETQAPQVAPPQEAERRGLATSPFLEDALPTAFGPDLGFNATKLVVWRGDKQEDLTPLETALLEGLVQAPRHRLSRKELRLAGWGNDIDTGTNRVDFHMSQIRHKLIAIDSPVRVVAVRRYGYALVK